MINLVQLFGDSIMLNTEQHLEVFNAYRTFSEKVYYAHKRLQKIGIEPYSGKYDGTQQDIFTKAMQQAKKENNEVAVYLNGEVEGLFVVAPERAADDLEYCAARFENYKQQQEAFRWDKPIEEQKKEEEFDRFRSLKYGKEILDRYGSFSIELCYADERLRKYGVQPYNGAEVDNSRDIFDDVVKQARNTGKRTAFYASSFNLNGLFVISPEEKISYETLVKNQERFRWDKPVEQQKSEEKAMSDRLTQRGRK